MGCKIVQAHLYIGKSCLCKGPLFHNVVNYDLLKNLSTLPTFSCTYFVFIKVNGSCHEKKYHWACAISEDSNQSAHQASPISLHDSHDLLGLGHIYTVHSLCSGTEVIKKLFLLNSTEHEIYPAYKC